MGDASRGDGSEVSRDSSVDRARAAAGGGLASGGDNDVERPGDADDGAEAGVMGPRVTDGAAGDTDERRTGKKRRKNRTPGDKRKQAKVSAARG